METDSYLTKEEFIAKFKLNYQLAVKDSEVMSSYESYCNAIRDLRSWSIKELKIIGMPGYLRADYNDLLQMFAQSSHRKYLFYKNPVCGICNQLIERLRDATIDHIIPTSKGGPNILSNKQIAHGPCNVRKSNKIGKKWKNHML